MLIKVCGMREADNIAAVRNLKPNFMGLIFYPKSSRFVGEEPSEAQAQSFGDTKKVGVFVNESIDYIKNKIATFGLDMVQLHGSESPEMCKALTEQGIAVIKAFSITTAEDLNNVAAYDGYTKYNLLDTKTPKVGGSGMKFDWSILDHYKSSTPFLLSGGIDADDVAAIKALRHPSLAGVDLNSKFEIAPALKDADKLARFFEELRK